MALKKTSTPRKAAAKTTAKRSAEPERATGSAGSNPNRLLREAAWNRMFGRTESKNPFSR
jgi:hypothetical protein